jgi:hypothetical protein
MTTGLEDRLRADMARFTADLHITRGLAAKAYERRRRHRARLRVLTASAAAIILVASGLAGAEASGAFSSGQAPSSPKARLTAFVVQHVENALGSPRLGNLIGYTRLQFPPGAALEPSPAGISGPRGPRGAQAQWSVGSTTAWQYRNTVEMLAYSPSGQRVFSVSHRLSHGAGTVTAVLYGSRTWWTAPAEPGTAPAGGGCAAGSSIRLSTGPGNGWPALIRSQLACGAFSVAGHQDVDGVNAIKIAGPVPGFTLWVNPATYLPVQLTVGSVSASFEWLAPTAANLGLLHLTVPAGFRQVPPPALPVPPQGRP